MKLNIVELPNTSFEKNNTVFEYYQYGPYVLRKESNKSNGFVSYSVDFAHNFWEGVKREIDPALDTNTAHMVSTFTSVPMYLKWDFDNNVTHSIELTFSSFNGTHEETVKRVEEMMIATQAAKAFEEIINSHK